MSSQYYREKRRELRDDVVGERDEAIEGPEVKRPK